MHLMAWFHALTVCGWLLVVVAARFRRPGPFAAFVGVLGGIYSLVAVRVLGA